MTEFKVGDRVEVVSGRNEGQYGVIDSAGVMYDWRVKLGPLEYCFNHDSELRHATPVPIGYTGKMRDMDLKEGDVVRSEVSKNTYTIVKDCNDELATGYWGVTVYFSNHTYTLISRANTANTPAWSKWRMSKEDGTIQETWDEIKTHPIPGMAHQVLYRGRNIPPVTHEFEVDGVAYTVDVKGGAPDWGSVEVKK